MRWRDVLNDRRWCGKSPRELMQQNVLLELEGELLDRRQCANSAGAGEAQLKQALVRQTVRDECWRKSTPQQKLVQRSSGCAGEM